MTTILMFPGQGSQKRGMGKHLFARFSTHMREADDVLGYSLERLCIDDPDGLLDQTEFTQPAVYVVNALEYLSREQAGEPVNCALGHSLGEYSALFAAGVFDFATGLRLVVRRGALMGRATQGGLSAVLGLDTDRVEHVLHEKRLEALDIANLNTPTQIVIAGPLEVLKEAEPHLREAGARYVLPLRVGAAFHSRYMQAAADEFARCLHSFSFNAPRFPVYANVDALPYTQERIHSLLARQIASPVRWVDSIRNCLTLPFPEFVEMGAGHTLSKMVKEIRGGLSDVPNSYAGGSRSGRNVRHARQVPAKVDPTPQSQKPLALGSARFAADFKLTAPYMAGAMYRGIASEALVIAMAKAGFLASYGAGGLSHERVERAVSAIRGSLGDAHPFAVNLLHEPNRPDRELALVRSLIDHRVNILEASAFMTLAPALVYFRAKGLRVRPNGVLDAKHRIIAKVSRPEVAEAFMSPPPERMLHELVQRNLISSEEAGLCRRLPVADAITTEADSGGHTDKAVLTAVLPAMIALRDRKVSELSQPISVGAAGGIGTPSAMAAAFVLGADYVVTGSINQCTVESGASDAVKDILQEVEVQDTAMAPAGDMFEMGARIQVVRRGVLFPTRANKLYDLYCHHNSLDQIDTQTRHQLETRYFQRSFDDIYRETQAYFAQHDPSEIERAEADPKHKLALVFRWYFAHSSRLAAAGDPAARVDYQIHCGPAMGAFNAWAQGTPLASWRQRRAANIAKQLLEGASQHLHERGFGASVHAP